MKRALTALTALLLLLSLLSSVGCADLFNDLNLSPSTTVGSTDSTGSGNDKVTSGGVVDNTNTDFTDGGFTSDNNIVPIEPVKHKDDDGDEICDDCGNSVIVKLDFYSVNDLHGKFCDTDSQPGVDELTKYFKNAKNKNPNTILLSTGDMWQGSSESNLTEGAIVTEWMNNLGFASMTLGNHEFDWGEDKIKANDELANFPFLAINIYNKETDKRVDYCKSSVMVEKNGVKIGIIGAIGDCYSSISGERVKDVYFKTGKELSALVKVESEMLKARGADFIIYAIHDGYGGRNANASIATDSMISSYYDVSLSDGYVDLVFEGHSHYYYTFADKHGVYHLQGGGDNDGISHVSVNVNLVNKTHKVDSASFVPISQIASAYEGDAMVGELLQKYDDKIAVGNKLLGTTSKKVTGDTLRQLSAKLYYQAGEEMWGDKYDIALGGGYFSVRSPYNLEAGEIRYSHLQTIFPFDNQLVLCSIKGRDLRDRFFETDNSNYFIYYGAYGASIRDNIDLNATYYVIVDTYSSSYAPNKLTVVEYYTEGVYTRDLLAKYAEEGGFN